MADIPARMRSLTGTTAQWAADDIVIADGEIAVERRDDASVRIKIGNGVDTFSELPYVYGGAFGDGYEWGTPTRTHSTPYTAPDHPILVNHISRCVANNGETNIIVGGVTVATGSNGGNGNMVYMVSAIIPPGATYTVTQSNLDSHAWLELRADF